MRLKKRVEELEVENKSLWRAITNYESHYSELCNKMKKQIKEQEEAINELTRMCQTLLFANFNDCMKDLENELKDLFGSEPSKKCKKGAKSSAEKRKKCGESAKTTKKTSKKGE